MGMGMAQGGMGMAQMGQMNQMGQTGQMNQMGSMNQMAKTGQMAAPKQVQSNAQAPSPASADDIMAQALSGMSSMGFESRKVGQPQKNTGGVSMNKAMHR